MTNVDTQIKLVGNTLRHVFLESNVLTSDSVQRVLDACSLMNRAAHADKYFWNRRGQYVYTEQLKALLAVTRNTESVYAQGMLTGWRAGVTLTQTYRECIQNLGA